MGGAAADNDDDVSLFDRQVGGAMQAAVPVETGKDIVHGSAAELVKGRECSMDTAAPWLQLGPDWFPPTLILEKRKEIQKLLTALRAKCSSSGMSGKQGSAVKRPR
jgi:hypothetical protein